MQALVLSVVSLILCAAIIAYIAYCAGYLYASSRFQKELNRIINDVKMLNVANSIAQYSSFTTPPPPSAKKKPHLHIFRSDNKDDKSPQK